MTKSLSTAANSAALSRSRLDVPERFPTAAVVVRPPDRSPRARSVRIHHPEGNVHQAAESDGHAVAMPRVVWPTVPSCDSYRGAKYTPWPDAAVLLHIVRQRNPAAVRAIDLTLRHVDRDRGERQHRDQGVATQFLGTSTPTQ